MTTTRVCKAGDEVRRDAMFMAPRYGVVLEVTVDWYYPTTHSTRKVSQLFASVKWDDSSVRDVSVDLLTVV